MGRGSTFDLALPVAESRQERGPSLGQLPAPQRSTRSLTVLIIDDNVEEADSLGVMLAFLGHEPRVAYGGVPGLHALSSFEPDLVFCDLGIADVDGCEVARRMRARNLARGPVLVALPGWGGQSDWTRTRQAGFDFHLAKPLSLDKVREVFVRVSAEAAAPRRSSAEVNPT